MVAGDEFVTLWWSEIRLPLRKPDHEAYLTFVTINFAVPLSAQCATGAATSAD